MKKKTVTTTKDTLEAVIHALWVAKALKSPCKLKPKQVEILLSALTKAASRSKG